MDSLKEILSNKRPYYEFKVDPHVIRLIMDGQMPSQQVDDANHPLTDGIWTLCQKCWHFQPMQRPSMHGVIAELRVRSTGIGSQE